MADDCSVEQAIELIGGKWKLLIIRALLAEGPLRFNELSRALRRVSHKVLTEKLRELESHELVEHVAEDGRHVYQLSATAAELYEVLKALGDWHERHAAASFPEKTVGAEQR